LHHVAHIHQDLSQAQAVQLAGDAGFLPGRHIAVGAERNGQLAALRHDGGDGQRRAGGIGGRCGRGRGSRFVFLAIEQGASAPCQGKHDQSGGEGVTLNKMHETISFWVVMAMVV
jgi:hypothetical protein